MRNPWPMIGIFVITGLVGAIYVTFFATQHIWKLAFALILVVVLAFWVYTKYSNWLVTKLNNVVLAYQENRDTEIMLAEFKKWRFVASKYARDVMRINWTIALMEHERFDEAKAQIDALRMQAETTYDWLNYHIILADYAERTGDKALARQEELNAEASKNKIETQKTNLRERATKAQSKRAFMNWLGFSLTLFIGGLLAIYVFKTTLLGSIGVAVFILSWFAIMMTVGWGILWAIR